MTSSLMPLLAFVAVVAMIPVALWLMRRSGVGGAGTTGLLRTVGSLSLSPSQRVVVVELMQGANAKWLVVGVSPERLTTLTEMDAPAEVPGEIQNPQAQSVSALISKWRGNTGGTQS